MCIRDRHKTLDYTNHDLEIITKENPVFDELKTHRQVYEWEQNRIKELEFLVKEKTKRKSQIKDYFTDGLLSIGRDKFKELTPKQRTELVEVSFKFIDDFAKKHNTTLLHKSAHFDEGFFDVDKVWQPNAHIQFCFENVNSETGKAINSRLTRQDLRQLQTDYAEVVKHLGFVRGKEYNKLDEPEMPPKHKRWKDFKRQKAHAEEQSCLLYTSRCV